MQLTFSTLPLAVGLLLSAGSGSSKAPEGHQPQGWAAFDVFCPDCEIVGFHDRVSGAYVTAIVSRTPWKECAFSAAEKKEWREPGVAGSVTVCIAKNGREAVLDRVRREAGPLSDYNIAQLERSLPKEGCAYLEAEREAPVLLRFSASICSEQQLARVEELIRAFRELPRTRGVRHSTPWRALREVRLGDSLGELLRVARSPQGVSKNDNGLRFDYEVDNARPGCRSIGIEISQNQVVSGMNCK